MGPVFYRTNNMNYGSMRPADWEIQDKFYPASNKFTKEFTGGNFNYNGLNCSKTISNVHSALNDF